MADWYETGKERLYDDAVAETGLTKEQFKKAYAFLSQINMIDYDLEKEIIFEVYADEVVDDEDDEDEGD